MRKMILIQTATNLDMTELEAKAIYIDSSKMKELCLKE